MFKFDLILDFEAVQFWNEATSWHVTQTWGTSTRVLCRPKCGSALFLRNRGLFVAP